MRGSGIENGRYASFGRAVRRTLGINGWKDPTFETTEHKPVGSAAFDAGVEVLLPASYDIAVAELGNSSQDLRIRRPVIGLASDLALVSGAVIAGFFVAKGTNSPEAGVAVGSAMKVVFNAATHKVTDRLHRRPR